MTTSTNSKVCIAGRSVRCGRKGKGKKVGHHIVNRCRNHCDCRYQIDLSSLPVQVIENNVVRRLS
jgi:hypothetical protein